MWGAWIFMFIGVFHGFGGFARLYAYMDFISSV